MSWRGRQGFREIHVSLSLSITGGFNLSYHTIIFPYCGDDLGEPVPARVKSASRSQSSQDLRAGGRAVSGVCERREPVSAIRCMCGWRCCPDGPRPGCRGPTEAASGRIGTSPSGRRASCVCQASPWGQAMPACLPWTMSTLDAPGDGSMHEATSAPDSGSHLIPSCGFLSFVMTHQVQVGVVLVNDFPAYPGPKKRTCEH